MDPRPNKHAMFYKYGLGGSYPVALGQIKVHTQPEFLTAAAALKMTTQDLASRLGAVQQPDGRWVETGPHHWLETGSHEVLVQSQDSSLFTIQQNSNLLPDPWSLSSPWNTGMDSIYSTTPDDKGERPCSSTLGNDSPVYFSAGQFPGSEKLNGARDLSEHDTSLATSSGESVTILTPRSSQPASPQRECTFEGHSDPELSSSSTGDKTIRRGGPSKDWVIPKKVVKCVSRVVKLVAQS